MDDPATPDPVLVPPLVPLGAILAGQAHAPVVYFAQVSGGVKIGWTENLARRMQELYIPVAGVLAVVPGGRDVEDAFHERFAAWQVNDGRREVFNIEHLLAPALRTPARPARPASVWRAERWAKPARQAAAPRPKRTPGPKREPRPKRQPGELDRGLLGLLAQPGGTSSRKAGAALGVSHATAARHLRKLKAAGLAELTGDAGSNRRSRITAAGLATLTTWENPEKPASD